MPAAKDKKEDLLLSKLLPRAKGLTGLDPGGAAAAATWEN
jgi:hypothetical protein